MPAMSRVYARKYMQNFCNSMTDEASVEGVFCDNFTVELAMWITNCDYFTYSRL
jgi:hypothetical protein